jgi:hypothetical protein
VYADESGKTGDSLLVGSVWFVNPEDTWRLARKILEWRGSIEFKKEFHFANMSEAEAKFYIAFIDLVFDATPSISFKSIQSPRAGTKSTDAALEWLFFELVKRGIAHEDAKGRAPLPRRLMLWKDQDAEGKGRDAIAVAKLRDRLVSAAASQFDERLLVEAVEALDSRTQPLLQLADLYVGSINRVLARKKSTGNGKDTVADYLLDRIEALGGPEILEQHSDEEAGDPLVHLTL